MKIFTTKLCITLHYKSYNMKKIICFDLDGTLAPSKERLDDEMVDLVNQLLEKYYMSVITWWWPDRFQRQIFDYITTDENLLRKFIACPNCGTKMLRYENWKWNKLYSLDFTPEEKKKILDSMNEVMDLLNLRPEKTRWDIVEDRWSQITFSALWQNAPLQEKQFWDPDFKKRNIIKAELEKRIPEFSINSGWTTSIDITMKWVDKAFAIKKIMEYNPFKLEDILFIWDAIFPGWNDYPPFTIWTDCIKTNWVEHTKEIIKSLIENDLANKLLYKE